MTSPQQFRRIGVVGMGYVGLTLTAALARKGCTVYGVDTQPAVLHALASGKPHIYEPGVEEVFAEHVGTRILVGRSCPPSRWTRPSSASPRRWTRSPTSRS